MLERVRELLEATNCATLDPQRNERIESMARELAKSMRHEGHFFHIHVAAEALQIPPEDILLVKERLYELTLKRVFRKNMISGTDRTGLQWIGRTLHMTPEESRRIELRVGRRVFEEYLAFSISCGYLDEQDMSELRSIADSLSVSTRDLLLGFLAESAEKFLRRILTGLAEDGWISDAAWRRLLDTTASLGVNERELVTLLRPAARSLAEAFQKEKRWDPDVPIQPLRRLAERLGQPAPSPAPNPAPSTSTCHPVQTSQSSAM